MASADARVPEGTPPLVIGKAGRYTVFITPPATPKMPAGGPQPQGPGSDILLGPSPSPGLKVAGPPPPPPATKAPPSPPAAAKVPPVQVPPQQFYKSSARPPNSALGIFWSAVAKVQDAHSSLDEYLAGWLGLNQSKYQWALDDYYEKRGMDKEAGQMKDPVSKTQTV